MNLTHGLVVIALLAGAWASYHKRKLTLTGAVTGAVVGGIIFMGGGLIGLLLLALFFIAGTWASGWESHVKQKVQRDDADNGPRTAGQVLANGGMATIACLLGLIFNKYSIVYQQIMAASLSAAMADTLSSELGMVYGRRFFNILTFRTEKPGLDGVISLEGTLIGAAGSLIIAVVFCLMTKQYNAWIGLVLCGTIGNLTDSLLGATLERKGYLGNNAVNFFNTAIAAIAMWGWYVIST